jgi:hypothetical protein
MMGERYPVWDEPLIGLLFGDFWTRSAAGHNESRPEHFIFGERYRESWSVAVHEFVLSQAAVRFPVADRVVAVDPNGSIGAPFLMDAMPQSRLVVLVRDPRDAVASSLASHQRGGWLYEWTGESTRNRWRGVPDEDPDTFVRGRARFYANNVGAAKRAYDAHEGPKVLLRYEDLRTNTLSEMRRLYSALGIAVDETGLARAVEKHSWENLPANEKGVGKFNRKAKPGSWSEDLTPKQVQIVEKITGPLLRELYA